MSDELKPCPFCGNEPAPYWKGVGCATSGCLLNGLHLDADKWNRRAQPAEAEGVEVVAWRTPSGSLYDSKEVAEKNIVTGHICKTEPLVLQSNHLAALSAVTAERDAANSRLHEVAVACAEAEAERDQLRAEVDGLRSDALPDGFVSAPLEPSLAMQNAGWNEIASQGIDPEAVEIGPIYRAMIAAMAAKEA